MNDFLAYFEWFDQFVDEDNLWVLKSGIIIFCTMLVAVIWAILRRRLLVLVEKSKTLWDDAIVYAIQSPITWSIWFLGLNFFAVLIAKEFSPDVVDEVIVVRKLGLLVLFSWLVWRLINGVIERQIDRGKDPTTMSMLGNLSKIGLVVLIALPALQILGVQISGILAFGGMGGLIVGMAAKDMLANFFGAIIIYMDKPFKVGDWIRSPDRQIEGVVEHIGLRVTQIRTFDKRPLYIPNSIFTNIVVENPSRMLNRRIRETIGIRYQDAHLMGEITQQVKNMLQEHPDIAHHLTLMVNFDVFNNSSLDFFIYTFTRTTDWMEYHKIKQDVLLKILNIIESLGAECAFPSRTLYVDGFPNEAMKDSLNKGSDSVG